MLHYPNKAISDKLPDKNKEQLVVKNFCEDNSESKSNNTEYEKCACGSPANTSKTRTISPQEKHAPETPEDEEPSKTPPVMEIITT